MLLRKFLAAAAIAFIAAIANSTPARTGDVGYTNNVNQSHVGVGAMKLPTPR